MTFQQLKQKMQKGEHKIWLCDTHDVILEGVKNSPTPKCDEGGTFQKLSYSQYRAWYKKENELYDNIYS